MYNTPMTDTNNTPNQTRKMLTRHPFVTALFEIPSRDATYCVSALEDGEEPARVWCIDHNHAILIAATLPKYGFTDIEIEEA